jgi:hypothetical protein
VRRRIKSGGALGGFTDTQLGPAVWRVSILGNGARTTDEVKDMVLLRSAELVRAAGYSHFVVRQSADQTSTAGLGIGAANGGVFASIFQPIKYPEISMVIEARNSAGSGTDFAYDAAFLMQSVGQKYRAQRAK